MIPLRDNIPTRRFPLVCVALIAVNVAVFLADKLTGHVVLIQAVTRTEIPVTVQRFEGGLSETYSMVPAQVTADFANAWPTIFTSMFLHANWLHVGGNMLMLWIFGNNVEDTLGRIRFLLFYLVCGAAAGAAHIYSNPASNLPTVGASGAVAGMMGAYLILFPRATILTIVPIFIVGMLMDLPAIFVIGAWAAVQFLNANWLGGGEMLRGGGVAYMAHVGGFIVGIVLILMLGGRRLSDTRDERLVEDWNR